MNSTSIDVRNVLTVITDQVNQFDILGETPEGMTIKCQKCGNEMFWHRDDRENPPVCGCPGSVEQIKPEEMLVRILGGVVIDGHVSFVI